MDISFLCRVLPTTAIFRFSARTVLSHSPGKRLFSLALPCFSGLGMKQSSHAGSLRARLHVGAEPGAYSRALWGPGSDALLPSPLFPVAFHKAGLLSCFLLFCCWNLGGKVCLSLLECKRPEVAGAGQAVGMRLSAPGWQQSCKLSSCPLAGGSQRLSWHGDVMSVSWGVSCTFFGASEGSLGIHNHHHCFWTGYNSAAVGHSWGDFLRSEQPSRLILC